MGLKRWLFHRYLGFIKKQLRVVAEKRPGALVEIMRSDHMAILVRGLSDRKYHSWNRVMLEKAPRKFEDLAFLFWSTPINRGIARLDLDEAAMLFRTVSSMNDPRGVEIGRFAGGSTYILATAIGSGGRLDSIDISPHDDQVLSDVLLDSGLAPRVSLHVADANDFVHEADLDFAFIDGDHSYEGAKKDHFKWGEKVKMGGYILHHDMGNTRPHSVQWPSLKSLYEDILENQANELELHSSTGSLVVFKRISTNWTPF